MDWPVETRRAGGYVPAEIKNLSVIVGSRESLFTTEDAKRLQKQFQEIADDRIREATRYRGVLNPK